MNLSPDLCFNRTSCCHTHTHTRELTIQLFPFPLHPSMRIPSMNQSCTFNNLFFFFWKKVQKLKHFPELCFDTASFYSQINVSWKQLTKKSKNYQHLRKRTPWCQVWERAFWKTIWHFCQRRERTPERSFLCLRPLKAQHCRRLDLHYQRLSSSPGPTGFL